MPVLALLEALFVVGLWSASPILVQSALTYLTPSQVAGTRYFGAFLAMLPLVITRARPWLRQLTRRDWLRLAAMGVLSYAIGNTLFFLGLESLTPTTSSFLLNAIPVMTLVIGIPWLGERPNRWQVVGVGLTLVGGAVFFGGDPELSHGWHVAATLLGAFCLSLFAVMNRQFARTSTVDVAGLAAVPLFFGGGLLMLITPPSVANLRPVAGIIAWLALANSALAYLLWNHALKRLKAFEIGIVASLMPIGTALLSPVMVGEVLPLRGWLGVALALVGVLLVGLTSTRPTTVPITMEAVPVEEGPDRDPTPTSGPEAE
ncbi:MAG: DMT family transporter [Chloroflexota bacterium]